MTRRPDRMDGHSRAAMLMASVFAVGGAAAAENHAESKVDQMGQLPDAIDYVAHTGSTFEGAALGGIGFMFADNACNAAEYILKRPIGKAGRMAASVALTFGLSAGAGLTTETEEGIKRVGQHIYAQDNLHPDKYDLVWGVASAVAVAAGMSALRPVLLRHQARVQDHITEARHDPTL